MSMLDAHRPTPIYCTGLLRAQGWRLKVYLALGRAMRIRPELVTAAKDMVYRLPQPPDGGGRHGVGFLCVHDGAGAPSVSIDWWTNENDLHHLRYVADSGDPVELHPVPPGGPVPHGWHLAIVSFEHRAWLETVLADPHEHNLDRYLQRRLTALI